jgi:hypothetical protein
LKISAVVPPATKRNGAKGNNKKNKNIQSPEAIKQQILSMSNGSGSSNIYIPSYFMAAGQPATRPPLQPCSGNSVPPSPSAPSDLVKAALAAVAPPGGALAAGSRPPAAAASNSASVGEKKAHPSGTSATSNVSAASTARPVSTASTAAAPASEALAPVTLADALTAAPASTSAAAAASSSSSSSSDHNNSSKDSADANAYHKIFVKGMHNNTRDREFRSYFERYGRVLSAEVVLNRATNRATHKSRGFGFIIFEQESSVDLVCDEREHIIDGKMVEVKRDVPRTKGSVSAPAAASSPARVVPVKPEPDINRKPKNKISFSAVADELRDFLQARGSSRPAMRRLSARTSDSPPGKDCTDIYLVDLEAYIKRAITSGDVAHITSQLTFQTKGYGFRRLPSHVFLLNQIKNNAESSEVAVAVLSYLYRNCSGSWKEQKLNLDIALLMNGIKRILSTIQTFHSTEISEELEGPTLDKTVLVFSHFTALVADIVSRDNLTCTGDFAKTWFSYFVDCIYYHMSREAVAVASSKKPAVYTLTMGQLSKIVIQRCFDMIDVLLRLSCRLGITGDGLWASVKNSVALDSIFFLKYYHIRSLKVVFESLATEVWAEKDRVVLSS